MIKIHDVTEDQLAKDWTLSEVDINFIIQNTRGEVQQMRCEIQLCSLRQSGRFVIKQADVPIKAVNYLAQQLTLPSLIEVPDLALKDADYGRLQKIQHHLHFKEFDQAEKDSLQSWLLAQVQDHVLDQRELTNKTKAFLKQFPRTIILTHQDWTLEKRDVVRWTFPLDQIISKECWVKVKSPIHADS